MIGIYTITNLVNNKVYVGLSSRIKERFHTHITKLRSGKHTNIYLQSSFNKYGEKSFLFEVLIECEEKFLCSEEHYWSNLLNSKDRKYGYNIDITNPYTIRSPRSKKTKEKLRIINLGKRKSPETLEKIRLSSIGRKWSEETRIKFSKSRKGVWTRGNKKIPIIQYSLEGNFIKEWDSAKDAAVFIKTQASEISGVCRHYAGTSKNKKKTRRKTVKGFIWKYK